MEAASWSQYIWSWSSEISVKCCDSPSDEEIRVPMELLNVQ